jgi:hypothetical protein
MKKKKKKKRKTKYNLIDKLYEKTRTCRKKREILTGMLESSFPPPIKLPLWKFLG